MDIQNAITLALVFAAAAYAARYFYKSFRGDAGCGCGCHKSDPKKIAGGARPTATPKRLPLVTPDDLGKPYPSSSLPKKGR